MEIEQQYLDTCSVVAEWGKISTGLIIKQIYEIVMKEKQVKKKECNFHLACIL